MCTLAAPQTVMVKAANQLLHNIENSFFVFVFVKLGFLNVKSVYFRSRPTTIQDMSGL